MSVSLKILGPVEVWREGQLATIGPAKRRVMLAALALNANKAVGLSRLVEAVWLGPPPGSAVANLRTHAAGLRRALGDRVVARSRGYELRLEPGELDADEFVRWAASGRLALERGDVATAIAHLSASLTMWRGAAGDGLVRGVELDNRLIALDQRRLDVFEDYLQVRSDVGDYADLVAQVRGHLAAHPLRERAWRQLMLLLYRRGDVAAALAAYGQARAVLDQQLGMDPGEELVALHRAILNRDPALDAPPGAGFGRQGLAVHVGLPPRQLPADIAGFVGRSSDLASLEAALRNALLGSGPAAVVVRGAGGTGKTALAVRAAHQVGTLFPGGQIFIDLGGVTGGYVPDATVRVLRALGVRPADMPDGADERAALFRSLVAGRRVLVVLDDAATAGQIRPLVTSGSGLLVTSRRLLATLDRAAYVDLGPLPAEHGLELLHALAGGGRFAAERAAAAEIVRRCAGLPLALRIVGARLASRPDWPLALMAEELAERPLETLEFEDLSVRAAIDVDYRAVADAPLAAQVLRMLSRLSDAAATTQALAGHLGEPPSAVSRALERLVDCGLAESPMPRLYRLPALVREYAAELAAADISRLSSDA